MRVVGIGITSFLLSTSNILAQNPAGIEFHIKKAESPITLDGQLSESDWLTGDVAKNFYMNNPVDSMAPLNPTEVRMTFDDHHLYIGFTCFETNPAVIIQSLRRDFDFRNNDNL
ncbi:MAG: hydrolase, partial [Cyclobacteriaceae bacterium]|nr:hydrolase [Cyclobacteriaceae bacterium]